MTSVWFAASGSGEDGDEYDVHAVFATHEAAQAHCDRPGKPKWECRYVEEWKVTGSILADAERQAIYRASQYLSQNDVFEGMAEDAAVLRGLLERLGGEK